MVKTLKFKTIRSQAPKCVNICESNETYKVDDKHMEKVQRLDGCGFEEIGHL